jgi:hypothetical protein
MPNTLGAATMGIPFLQLPDGLGWSSTLRELERHFAPPPDSRSPHSPDFVVYGEWRGVAYWACLRFVDDRFSWFNITVPVERESYDARAYIDTAGLLSGLFGEPDSTRGMSFEELANDDDWGDRAGYELPAMTWELSGATVTHFFHEHWGVGAQTWVYPPGQSRPIQV